MVIYKTTATPPFTILKSVTIIAGMICLVAAVHHIPLDTYLKTLAVSAKQANYIEDIVFNVFLILIAVFVIQRYALAQLAGLSLRPRKILFYAFGVWFLFLFTGGFSSIYLATFNDFKHPLIAYYGLDTLFSAFLEEVVFRGLIQTLLLITLLRRGVGLLTALLLSSLIFGSLHLINALPVSSSVTLKSVSNQMYAATGVGFLFGTTLLKTRNIYPLVLIHATTNFFAGLHEVVHGAAEKAVSNAPTSTFNEIMSVVLTLVVMGTPLLIGLFVYSTICPSEYTDLITE